MDSSALSKLVAPFKLLVNRGAQAPHYRAIELASDHIKACAPFGMLDVGVALDLDEDVHVDASAFLAVVASLPAGDLELSIDNNILHWSCGNAAGRLAVIEAVDMPATPDPDVGCLTTKELAKAFALGALSADDNAVGQDNFYGVTIDNDGDNLIISATDNNTVSCYYTEHLDGAPPVTTIAPKAAELFAAVINDQGALDFGANSVVYFDDDVVCTAQYVKPVRYNVRKKLLETLGPTRKFTKIPPDRINAFIKRATALSENRVRAMVNLTAEGGKVAFSFQEITTATDEFFISNELKNFAEIDPVPLLAVKVARALAHTDELVLDYISGNPPIVLFRGGLFHYYISGPNT